MTKKPRILMIWGNWGPYHYARFQAFHQMGMERGLEVHGLELFPASGFYDWTVSTRHPAVHHLKVGEAEDEFNLPLLLQKLLPLLVRLRCDIIFVPSYWHWSLFANLTGRLTGARIVMMNESHAGTQRATGWKQGLKRIIVRSFHAGFVGGSPHIRHFSNLGLDSSVIFSGYDAVDNEYFTQSSQEVRRTADTVRAKLQLPASYFLSLGRMVPKKNLPTLVRAYVLFRQRNPEASHHLVFVGSGQEEQNLREVCQQLNLTVFDHSRDPVRSDRSHNSPSVHFFGFRQIDENPAFYALATAFILPSSTEEWGLVVNEAMACGLPVIVSREAGCAEDLVVQGRNGYTFDPSSADELADALTRMTDPPLTSRMGEASLEIARHWGCDRFAHGALRAAAAAAERPEFIQDESLLT